ncbi:hypothetical protein DFQ05_0715 [Winogradskyella wandonensis]|uniref:Uncharacterized protein n=1 Tax=Winogradskyella wandonensis TaxID=1442586 RepID=A0A4R1KVI7_9FLAO|nr:hypothetical protein [Winogradskyella wandonensis]TCK69195.1 hypothetical protein DFQ05_0715 [Winogradskyella wandonensis]
MNKYTKLFLSLLLDGVGYLSFVIPGVGELSDVIWAPLSGYIMTKLYKGKTGRVAGIIAFVEEAFPFSDVVPTFTLMWIYTYLITSKKNS